MNLHDPITRLNAALEGRYRVERELGEGGMATVYLAEDLRHERKVALKVLKPELAAVVGAERFLTEIKTTANLQHPHILALFDSSQAESFLYYVMPFVEGESLRERLDRDHQLPIDEAVGIATNMAEALDYAHRQGVIHRDVKPANVLMLDGKPVISDFGIALAVGAAGGGRLTETGLSLGTPHYMSPEQATGDQNVGPQTDTYAPGCVLYEMLVGEPPYTGPNAQAVLGQIITGEPISATKKRASIPQNVDAVIRRALEKLPADRFGSAQEFAKALEDTGFRHGDEVVAGVATARGLWNPLSMALGALALVLAVGLGWMVRSSGPERGPLWLDLNLGEIVADPFGDLIVAPDGSAFATAGQVEGETALYARRAGEARFRRLPGTEDARYPTFSPDGEWIAFRDFSQDAILRVPLDGGTPLALLPDGVLVNPSMLNRGDDGTIVFRAGSPTRGLFRIAETGGQPELLLESGTVHYFPRLLPGGSGMLLTDRRTLSISVFDLAADTVREIIPEGVDATYVDTGHIVYAHPSGGLFAAPFDLNVLDVTGPPVPVVDDVSMVVVGGQGIIRARYSISQNGTLVYGAGGPVLDAQEAGQRLLIVDLEGNEEALVLPPRNIGSVAWSPDGQSVAYESGLEIYTYSVALGTTPRQLTFEGINRRPVFSPRGSRVAFSSVREGTDGRDLFVKTLDDDTPARSVIVLEGNQAPTQWPSDTLIVFETAQGGRADLWMLNLADSDSATAEVYLPSEANLSDIVVSRDGTLAAYSSDESGAAEVYIRSFPHPGERTPVSQGGGVDPVWSPDGNTVYYWRNDAGALTFMAARVQRQPTPVVLSRDSLFTRLSSAVRLPIAFGARQSVSDLHPDGDRLIVSQDARATTDPEGGAAEPQGFLVVTHWFEELCQSVGNP